MTEHEPTEHPEPEGVADGPPARPSGLAVEVEYDRCINFAMQQNDVPTVKYLRVTNRSADPIEAVDLRLWIDHDLSSVVELRKARLGVGDSWVEDELDLPLRSAVLLSQSEREMARLHVELSWDGAVRHTESLPVEILAYNEWGGLDSLPEILAAFVTPNQDAVQRLLGVARDLLRSGTGDGSLAGYQAGGERRVAALTEACYAAIQQWSIGYVSPPASFEDRGQKVRFPHQIEAQRLATCLDLSLLVAACLEQCGLHPLVFLVRGHAFVGVWTADTCLAEPCSDDVTRVRKHVHLGDMLAFETTLLTRRSPVPFADAQAEALRHLQDPAAFVCAIDIRAARKLRIRPLPLRERLVEALESVGAPEPGEVLESVAADGAAALPVAEPAAPPEPEPEPETPETRLQKWKHKLLDLSLRNRLINFRETKKTIPLLTHDLAVLEDALATGRPFQVGPRPELGAEGGPRSLELHRERTQEDALQGFLSDELVEKRLRADLPPEELDKRLLHVYREARNNLEETGANTLFLAIGFLSWYEAESSDKERRAPILLLPLQITRRSVQDGFRLRLADDDPRINVTLLKKLQAEFHVDIDGLDDLPEDGSGLDVHRILQRFRKAVVNLDRWDVLERVCVGMFSFSKFLMWQDLEENADALLRAPVVRHLVETPGEAFGAATGWPDLDRLDDAYPPADVYCPLDADSSQLRAVFAAQDDRTFVLQGPPGTGKSQTIANLIAHALGHGKRVLFVAEKMAALDVVHDRLSRIGLGSACLELHSNKASKRQVLDQIQATLDQVRTRTPAEWQEATGRLQARRDELNRYVRKIHAPTACGLSFYQATARLIGLADVAHRDLGLQDVDAIDPEGLAQLHALVDALRTAAEAVGALADHPLRALAVEEFRANLRRDVEAVVNRLREAAAAVHAARAAITEVLALPAVTEDSVDSRDQLAAFAELATALLASPGPPADLLTEPGFAETRLLLEQQLTAGRSRDRLREELQVRFTPAFLEQDPAPWLARLERAQNSMAVLRWFRTWSLRRGLRPFARGGLPPVPELHQALVDLQRMQALDQELTAPSNLGATVFGRRWAGGLADWDALQEQLEWVERFRTLLLGLQSLGFAEADALRIRGRLLALATSDRDTVQGAAPNAARLQAQVDRWQDLQAAIAAGSEAVQLVPERAFGDGPAAGYLAGIGSWADRVWGNRQLREWCHWRRTRNECAAAGLEVLVAAAEAGEVAPAEFRAVFDRDFLDRLVCLLTDSEPVLRQFNSHEHETRIEAFRDLDRQVMDLSRQVVQASVGAQVPRLHDQASANSEMGILARQLRLKRRHLPIRRLFESLPSLLPRLKPCLLMSPLSVAQYLSPNFEPADLVVFDEASQIPVWDAIGALARGRNAVVVGDSKQLPPTSFFQRGEGDDEENFDEDTVQDMESILDECEVGGLKTLTLNWHYRSRHESLIAFSNSHYYDNRLYTFPSATAEPGPGLGVSMRHFPEAVYDKGKSRTNPVEAQAIRDEIVQRLQSYSGMADPPSIGVVAFSQVQQHLIEDLLEEARRQYPEIERFFGNEVKEHVFVKNLENVQGDERDTIMFSICYGPDQSRKVSMGFGPLNRQGGERRLNVAITRARCELVVFSSLRSDRIDLQRTQAVGVRHLRVFLDYAERGARALAEAVTLDPAADFDSPFEQAVYDALTARGHLLDLQVGCSGYRIDLAVRHPELPGRYVLGIECDGATYHSAATARDRDRIRAAALGGLGWRLHRIWSTDWWEDPERQIERVEAAIAAALTQVPSAADRVPEPAEPVVDDGPPSADEPPPGRADGVAEAGPFAGLAPAPEPAFADPWAERQEFYPLREPAPCFGGPDDIHEPAATVRIAERIRTTAAAEAPVLGDALFRRVAASWGIERVGARIRRRIQAVFDAIPAAERPVLRGDFVWLRSQDPASWRQFRVPAPGQDARKAEELPPAEIANAAEYVLHRQFGLPLEDLERETARLFGISRLGTKVRQHMASGIGVLESRGGCVIKDGQVTLAD